MTACPMKDPNPLGFRVVERDLVLRQGTDYWFVLHCTANGEDVPLDGYSFNGSIRKEPRSPTQYASINCTVVDGVQGYIRCDIKWSQSLLPVGKSPIDPASTRYWDLDCISPDGVRVPVAFGNVYVRAKGDIVAQE